MADSSWCCDEIYYQYLFWWKVKCLQETETFSVVYNTALIITMTWITENCLQQLIIMKIRLEFYIDYKHLLLWTLLKNSFKKQYCDVLSHNTLWSSSRDSMLTSERRKSVQTNLQLFCSCCQLPIFGIAVQSHQGTQLCLILQPLHNPPHV